MLDAPLTVRGDGKRVQEKIKGEKTSQERTQAVVLGKVDDGVGDAGGGVESGKEPPADIMCLGLEYFVAWAVSGRREGNKERAGIAMGIHRGIITSE